MKLAFFIGGMTRGGAERVISILANHYSTDNNVDIVMLLDNLVEYELSPSINTIDMTGNSNSYYGNILFWLKSIRQYVKKNKPDKIISFVGRINLLVLVSCFGLGVDIIVSERNDPKKDGRSRLLLRLCEWTYKRAKLVIFQNQYQKSCFNTKNLISEIIYNPISSIQISRCIRKHVLASSGRLTEQKNQKMMIYAIDKIKSKYPDIVLEIYGEGELRSDLELLIKKLGLETNVFLLGNVQDVLHRIYTASIYIMTSDYEGMPNALLEAMTLGMPCISTRFAGVEEFVTDTENGMLVDVKNVEELADKIQFLLDNPEKAEIIGAKAKKESQKFSSKRILDRWDEAILK